MLYYLSKALGYLLYNYKAGDSELIINLPAFRSLPETIEVDSSQFKNKKYMPVETAGLGVGQNMSPVFDLRISKPDPDIKSLVLICQDIDSPFPHPITHLIAYNIDASVKRLEAGELVEKNESSGLFKFGFGFRKKVGYFGPRPLVGHGDHRYVFQILAVNDNATLRLNSLPERPDMTKLLEIIEGNTLSYGSLTGVYRID